MSLGRRIGGVLGKVLIIALMLLVGAMLWGGAVVVIGLVER